MGSTGINASGQIVGYYDDSAGSHGCDEHRFLIADYTGQAAQYLLQRGINLNTKVTGFVTETPIGTKGLMEVSVNLEARNALTWVANVAGLNPTSADTAPLELGYRAQDLVANPNLKPALSNVHFQMTFQEQAGAPLPDLVQALLLGNAPPGFAIEKFDIQTWGTGTLDAGTTAGTPGQTAIVSTWQVADLTNSSLPVTLGDGFWQEPIDIIPVASASTHVAYLNGTLFVSDTSDSKDSVHISPAANGPQMYRAEAMGMCDLCPSETRPLFEIGYQAGVGGPPWRLSPPRTESESG
jgi:hypothetical protein